MPRQQPENEASLYRPWGLSDSRRKAYAKSARESAAAKAAALRGEGPTPLHDVNCPKLDASSLMKRRRRAPLSALSLFSGGGGLDLGYDLAGFQHVASYEWLAEGAATLSEARPKWTVFGGEKGDVRTIDWSAFRGEIDVVHGGPPCQPFSAAGRQNGAMDPRDMIPEFTRAILEIRPRAFQMENVPALTQKKFTTYIRELILDPLSNDYEVQMFFLRAADFGVPQTRRRVFFVGLRRDQSKKFAAPTPTHCWSHLTPSKTGAGDTNDHDLADTNLPRTMGAREALGLPAIGIDRLAPTLRSTLNGPRNTTSILSSTAAQRVWEGIQIWPNGVAADRESARAFVAKNGHFRLSVADCALLQGFPDSWPFQGPTYAALGQIGNAVPPPLAYAVAGALRKAL